MFARSVSIRLKTNRIEEFTRLIEGAAVPVPRTAFGLNKGLRTEFFATPDWTGRPVAVATEPEVQTDWENAKPVPEIDTTGYSVRWSGTIAAPASSAE